MVRKLSLELLGFDGTPKSHLPGLDNGWNEFHTAPIRQGFYNMKPFIRDL